YIVAHRLDLGRTIDIGHHDMVGVGVQERSERFRGAGIRQGTTGRQVGQQYLLGGIEDLCGLRHKVDARKQDDVRIRFMGPLGKPLTITYMVRDFLDLRVLVIMGQDQGVLFLFKLSYFVLKFHDWDEWSWEIQRSQGIPWLPKPFLPFPSK